MQPTRNASFIRLALAVIVALLEPDYLIHQLVPFNGEKGDRAVKIIQRRLRLRRRQEAVDGFFAQCDATTGLGALVANSGALVYCSGQQDMCQTPRLPPFCKINSGSKSPPLSSGSCRAVASPMPRSQR